ncbi:lipoprotein-releasing ABC transporter permease subunit [Desulfospira joergensenii]|uniref:lipoprotein-releasing ABC transporter permease subunit n=1 Tax=Desulfospira joergensenii TaxID=53329 RepID=UPI0003B7323B|nr:lipoprotein-releasing ABC transporter permease subunit [Desulfospira joergensenii]
MTIELFIARKYLKAKRKEGFISLITFLSVAGVTLGVMALVVVIAVMSGAETEFRKRILGLEPHILIMNYQGTFDNYQGLLDKLKTSPHIIDTSPILFGQAMIRTGRSFSGVMVRGISPEHGASLIKGYSAARLEKALGPDKTNGNLPGIILGKELANSVGVIEGDKLILMSSKSFISPIGQIPSMKRFVVRGTFSSGMSEYDGMLAYTRLDQAQGLVSSKDRISAIGIWVDEVFKVKSIREQVLNSLEYPFYIRDWMDINHSLFSALKLEKTAMFIILTLIILVAAFNIASALIMMVMDKTKEIAVLKAMGATRDIIRRIFMIKGMIIGFLGTSLGTGAGVLICFLLKRYDFIRLPQAYPFSTLPVELEVPDVVVIALSSLVICFLSTLYPSHKASKMDPVEAIRYG